MQTLGGIVMSFFHSVEILQSLKKAYSIKRDIPVINMNTHITLHA